ATPAAPLMWSASLRGPVSALSSSVWASPASTRCFSLSPAMAPRRWRHDGGRNRAVPRRERAPNGSFHAGAAFPPHSSDDIAGVRLAGDAEDQARADAAVRRHGVSDHVRPAVHLPLRWCTRRVATGVPPDAPAR